MHVLSTLEVAKFFFLRKVKLTKDTKPTKFVKNKFLFLGGFQNIVSWSTSKEIEIETWTNLPNSKATMHRLVRVKDRY